MDPVKISSPIPAYVGDTVWIPFDCINIKKDGSCSYSPAYDLPWFESNAQALDYLANNILLANRPLQWIEYRKDEISNNPEILPFFQGKTLQRIRSALRAYMRPLH